MRARWAGGTPALPGSNFRCFCTSSVGRGTPCLPDGRAGRPRSQVRISDVFVLPRLVEARHACPRRGGIDYVLEGSRAGATACNWGEAALRCGVLELIAVCLRACEDKRDSAASGANGQ